MTSMRFTDGLITYRILRMLVTPFNKTDAFRLGIIDDKGNVLRKERDLRTQEEKNAYTLLNRMVFRLKRIIEKVPVENKKLVSFAAALALIRESVENNEEPLDLEYRFLKTVPDKKSIELVENYMENKYFKTFRQFVEENGGGGGNGGGNGGGDGGSTSSAPANNAAVTPGVEGITGEPPVGRETGYGVRGPKVYRRKKKKEE